MIELSDVVSENDEDSVSSHSSCDNKQDGLRNFIEQYELSPELWNPTNPNYHNKAARNAALDRLIPFLKKIMPGANKREDVKKKINSLRTNFRKELKKIAVSKRSGKSTDELYTPSSWVFFALSFMERFEKPVQQLPKESAVNEELEQREDDGERQDMGENVQRTSFTTSTSSMLPPPFPQTQRPKKVKSLGPVSKQNLLLQKACSLLETSTNPDNNIPIVAKAWGEKLLTLDSTQRAFAEKAINDILFEASLGTLHRNSVEINVKQDPPRSPYSSQHSSTFSTFSYSSSPPQYTPTFVMTTPEPSNVEGVNNSLTTLFQNFQE